MNKYLLDTNIISLLIRKDESVEQRLGAEINAGSALFLSPIVYYEAKRGLLKRDASRKMAAFDRIAEYLIWNDLERADWDVAARGWADRIKTGAPISDADLLIAVQAKRLNAILVTNNEKDFDALNVRVENWKQ